MEHVAFSDDSKHEAGRYYGLGLVTLKKENYKKLIPKLNDLFKNSGIEREFKWEKVKNAKYSFCAEKIQNFIFTCLEDLRIDVLIWDMHDARHKDVAGRDEIENLKRMYYHLLSNVISRRWHESARWQWYPDEQSAIDWKEMGGYLVSKKYKKIQDLFGASDDAVRRLKIESIKPVESHSYSFLQLIDYFTGLGVYSYGHFPRYESWCRVESRQQSLFNKPEEIEMSNSEKVRFKLLRSFAEECKNRSLQVSLESSRGLFTRNPNTNINFWLYQPQHPLDKAPVKNKLANYV